MNEIKVIENNGQRVLTTAQIAELYDTTERRISENFNANKGRYIEGKHYYCLSGEEKRDFLNRTEIPYGSKATNFYLWTDTLRVGGNVPTNNDSRISGFVIFKFFLLS